MIKKFVFFGLLLAVGLAIFLAPFASQSSDGLEKVAEIKNFLYIAEGKEVLHSLIPDYLFPGIKNEKIATAVAGVVGILLVFVVSYVLGKLLKPRQ